MLKSILSLVAAIAILISYAGIPASAAPPKAGGKAKPAAAKKTPKPAA